VSALSQPQITWDAQRARAWHLFLPPARPSPGEVAIYEHALRQEIERQVPDCLLLGSTPELRSLAHRYRCPLHCVDRNGEVFRILAGMVDPPGPERFEERNWLDMHDRPTADVIFADGSMNMLPVALHSPFLDKLHTAVRPGGLAMLRVHLMRAPRFADAEAVFTWYRRRHRRAAVFSTTRTHLDMLWIDPRRQAVDFVEVHGRLRALHARGVITDEEFAAYDQLVAFNRITLHYAQRWDFERDATRHFRIEGIARGRDYAADTQHPVYLLRRPV
jgi:hypothetical protein